jgi:hypothetical protein
MTVTGSSAEVFFLTLPEEVELDTDQPTSRDALVASFRDTFTPLPENDLVDADVDDNVF